VEADSAGIRIVTSTAPAAEWTLAPEPELALGETPGDPAVEFFRVRAMTFVPGGRIAIANGGTESIRIFTTGGERVGEVGRSGAGPEEFSGLTWLAVRGDSLLAYDGGNDRVTVRDLGGAFARSFRLDRSSARPQPAALASDGTILSLAARGLAEFASQGMPAPGVLLDSALVTRHDPMGALLDSLARLPHNERFVRSGVSMGSMVGVPYTAFGRVAGTREGVCYEFGPDPQITCFGDDGSPRLLIRTGDRRRPVTPAHVAAYWAREAELAADDEARAAALASLRSDLPFPDVFPAFTDLIVDDDGRMWAEVYRLPDDDRTEWRIFSEGRWVGRLTVDTTFDVRAVSADLVAGVRRDELDVESIRIHRYEPAAR
jgi:hypothetical protein